MQARVRVKRGGREGDAGGRQRAGEGEEGGGGVGVCLVFHGWCLSAPMNINYQSPLTITVDRGWAGRGRRQRGERGSMKMCGKGYGRTEGGKEKGGQAGMRLYGRGRNWESERGKGSRREEEEEGVRGY